MGFKGVGCGGLNWRRVLGWVEVERFGSLWLWLCIFWYCFWEKEGVRRERKGNWLTSFIYFGERIFRIFIF